MSSATKNKNSQTLIADNNVVLSSKPDNDRQLAKLKFHLDNVIRSVLNASDSDTNNFSDADVAKLLDAMTKSIYDVNDVGIVDSASSSSAYVLKGSPGTINPGEVVWAVGVNQVELVDNTFLTGTAVGIALDPITDVAPGRIMINGEVTGIDTSLLAIGALWLSAVPGFLTQTPPVAGEKNQIAGFVIEVNAVTGAVLVRFSDIRNTDADFSIYNPGANVIITATDVQAALDQIEAALTGMSYYDYAADETSTIEAAGVYTSKVLLTIPVLPIGRYEWSWTAEVNCTATNRAVDVKFEENAAITDELAIMPADAANWYNVGAFKRFDQIAAGPLTLEIFFKRSANPATAGCRRARISIKSV